MDGKEILQIRWSRLLDARRRTKYESGLVECRFMERSRTGPQRSVFLFGTSVLRAVQTYRVSMPLLKFLTQEMHVKRHTVLSVMSLGNPQETCFSAVAFKLLNETQYIWVVL